MENQDLMKLIQDLKEGGFVYNDSDLCRKLGCSKSFLSEMKTGKRKITQQFVTRIHATFPDFFNGNTVPLHCDTLTLEDVHRSLIDHDQRFHDTVNRILDAMGVEPSIEKRSV